MAGHHCRLLPGLRWPLHRVGLLLRGAGDTRVPAILLLLLSWGVFVPLTHFLAFLPGQGWVADAPGLGLGAAGGWLAAVVYIFLLAMVLGWRWFSGRGLVRARVRI
jgi:MATE family multidrug resistance protein